MASPNFSNFSTFHKDSPQPLSGAPRKNTRWQSDRRPAFQNLVRCRKTRRHDHRLQTFRSEVGAASRAAPVRLGKPDQPPLDHKRDGGGKLSCAGFSKKDKKNRLQGKMVIGHLGLASVGRQDGRRRSKMATASSCKMANDHLDLAILNKKNEAGVPAPLLFPGGRWPERIKSRLPRSGEAASDWPAPLNPI